MAVGQSFDALRPMKGGVSLTSSHCRCAGLCLSRRSSHGKVVRHVGRTRLQTSRHVRRALVSLRPQPAQIFAGRVYYAVALRG